MLLLKSIASSHSTLGGEILLNLTSSAGSEQVKAWMQMSGEKQGERDQTGGTCPSTSPQKQTPKWRDSQWSICWAIFSGKASAPQLFAINTKALTPYICFILFWFRIHDFQTCFQLGKRGSNDNVVG